MFLIFVLKPSPTTPGMANLRAFSAAQGIRIFARGWNLRIRPRQRRTLK
jgi:hypothetical protein